ncbi:hypothetical protein Fmac_022272 [Flemingia macrophylla]|uniref:Uncharacterized protein n=1 Tax=Flemingia macrophylla TaxID=520843 RepID=A0ABD1LZ89_9FABA
MRNSKTQCRNRRTETKQRFRHSASVSAPSVENPVTWALSAGFGRQAPGAWVLTYFHSNTSYWSVLDPTYLNRSSFPDGFIFGAGSAAYQV